MAGFEHRELRSPRRADPALGHLGLDLVAPSREAFEHRGGDAVDVGDAVDNRCPGNAEATGELGPELRLVEIAGGLGVQVEVPRVECSPTAVRAARRVRDDDVRVEMGIAGSARAMPERGGDESIAAHLHESVRPASGPARLFLEVAQRGIDAGVVRGAYVGTDVPVAEPPEDGHGLRRAEGEIESRDSVLSAAGEAFSGTRIDAGQDLPEILGADPTVEAELARHGSEPPARRLTASDVVVLDALGDGFQVVVLLPSAELPDAQHDATHAPTRSRISNASACCFSSRCAIGQAGLRW